MSIVLEIERKMTFEEKGEVQHTCDKNAVLKIPNTWQSLDLKSRSQFTSQAEQLQSLNEAQRSEYRKQGRYIANASSPTPILHDRAAMSEGRSAATQVSTNNIYCNMCGQ